MNELQEKISVLLAERGWGSNVSSVYWDMAGEVLKLVKAGYESDMRAHISGELSVLRNELRADFPRLPDTSYDEWARRIDRWVAYVAKVSHEPVDVFDALREAAKGAQYQDLIYKVCNLVDGALSREKRHRTTFAALIPDLRKALGFPPTHRERDSEAKTYLGECWSFCPECGPGVKVDEDGLCIGCGSTAMGHAVDRLRATLLEQGAHR